MTDSSTRAPVPGHSLPSAVVIEDDPGMRWVVTRWLEASGYTVLKAPDGAQGLRFVEEHASLEFVLTDLVMPEISGQDVIEVLAEHRPEVPVLGMSAFPVASSDTSTAWPAIPILTKPFSPEELLATIQETRSRSANAGISSGPGRRDHTTSAKTDLVAVGLALVEARRLSAARRPLCPACGSKRVAAIYYGTSAPEVLQAYAAGRVVLGGVRESAGAPHWQCVNCGRRWDGGANRAGQPGG